MPEIGDKAPDFVLPSTVGEVRLSKLSADSKVLLAFYTEDFTPLCANQVSVLKDDFEIVAKVNATRGVVGLVAWSQAERNDPNIRSFAVGDINGLVDRRVNNVLDWGRESIAVYPIERNRTRRHLLVIRPEAIDAFLTCLRESPRADETFEGRRPRNRVLGYVRVGEEPSIRTLIVVETLLPMPLPTDEEDLLAPLPG